MKSYFLKSLRLTLVLLVLCSGLYTFLVYGAAQLVPDKGRGDHINGGDKSYYANIGQAFHDDRYFQGRPSAVGYNAAGSGGSNKGPYDKEYLEVVKGRIDTFLVHNPGISKEQIPVELVTASGSGLDPDLSPAAALVQVPRIAARRNIPAGTLKLLITKQTRKPLLGIMGPEKINVLTLNLALDQIKP